MRDYFWCVHMSERSQAPGDSELADALSVMHVISAPAAGGAETYVKQLAIELKRQGLQPIIAFIGHASDHGRSSEFEREFLSELETNKIEYVFIGDVSRKNPLLGAIRVRRYCRLKGVRLYHSHLTIAIIFGAFLSIPRLHTHHNSVTRLPGWVYKCLNPLVEQYVAISESCVSYIKRSTRRNIAVIRNGIDVSRFTPRVRRPVSGSVIDCICVGRIVAQKNYELLVSSIPLLPQRLGDQLRISIAGEGPAGVVGSLQKQIEQLGLSDRIKLLGNRLDVAELLDRSDLFLMSSAWEGLPIALLEATASGLPFIATDVGGCREVAELCGNGIVVSPALPQALANALAELMTDDERFMNLSEAAVRNAHKLSIEQSAREHRILYTQLYGRLRQGRRIAHKRVLGHDPPNASE